LGDAKERVGRRVCLMGNVDTTLLLTGNPSRVEAEAKRCIGDAAIDGGFILSSGCEVPLGAPLENVEAMVVAARKYGTYKRWMF
jgi:uroporphyrinogen decarboxylase